MMAEEYKAQVARLDLVGIDFDRFREQALDRRVDRLPGLEGLGLAEGAVRRYATEIVSALRPPAAGRPRLAARTSTPCP
jgi:hypothetical protein